MYTIVHAEEKLCYQYHTQSNLSVKKKSKKEGRYKTRKKESITLVNTYVPV